LHGLVGEELGDSLVMGVATGEVSFFDGFRGIAEHGLLRGVVTDVRHHAGVFADLVGEDLRVADLVRIAEVFRGEEIVHAGDNARERFEFLVADHAAAELAAVALNPGIIDTRMLRSSFRRHARQLPGPGGVGEDGRALCSMTINGHAHVPFQRRVGS
jgi:hypothetical protein